MEGTLRGEAGRGRAWANGGRGAGAARRTVHALPTGLLNPSPRP
jgi:hypothetical protein